jgi:hypothetical protein
VTDRDEIIDEIGNAGPERILFLADAFRIGMSLEEVFEETAVDPLVPGADRRTDPDRKARSPAANWPRFRRPRCAT